MLRHAAVGATIAMIAVVAPAAGGAAAASACTATTGVTVIVDFTHFAGGKIERGCAPGTPANGLIALHQAGFSSAGTAQYGDAFVCRIDGLPTPKQDACAVTPSPTAYWAFWHARPSDSNWTYTSVGVLDYHPRPGTIEAFAFGNNARPGVTPAEAMPPPATTTTTVAPTTTRPPPVTTATPPSVAPPTAATIGPLGSTTSTSVPRPQPMPKPKSKPKLTARPARTTTTRAAPSARSTVGIVERSASAPAAPGSGSGSAAGAILAGAIVAGLGGGAYAFRRARRRPA